MRTKPPVLAPLFRSEGQARLLAELVLGDVELSAQELADRVGLAYPTVWKEVRRLVQAQILRERTVGRRKVVSANPDSPLTGPVREILLVSAGPVPLLQQELSDIAGIDCAFVFGSFAARTLGAPGDAPNDIDVMVIGAPDPLAVYTACRKVGDQVGRPVNPTILTVDEWEADSVFLAEVRSGPAVPLIGDATCPSRP